MEDTIEIKRVIQTGLQQKWPKDKDDCDCVENNWPFLVWGITEGGRLITICPSCRQFAWGQEYEEE